MPKKIPLTQGQFALVDDDDYQMLSLYKWRYKIGYAARSTSRKEGGKTVFMHREIMNAPDNMDVDHINLNRSDNRKSNLRLCSKSQNEANGKAQKNNSSGFRGIDWQPGIGKWRSRIMVNGKRITIGFFLRSEDAAKAYDDAARKYFGEFALPNFPEEGK